MIEEQSDNINDGTSERLRFYLDEQKKNLDQQTNQQIMSSYECVMKYMNLYNKELKSRIQDS